MTMSAFWINGVNDVGLVTSTWENSVLSEPNFSDNFLACYKISLAIEM